MLGTQQSGHIFNIGFDLYCQLLKRAVARLSGTDPGLRIEVAFRADFIVTSESKWAMDGGSREEAAGLPGGMRKPNLLKASWKLALRPLPPATAPAFLPVAYIDDAQLRIAAHKAVAEASSVRELKGLSRAWRDRFGPIPEAADNLLRIAELKIAAAGARISAVEIRGNRLMLTRRGDFILIAGKFPRLTQNAGRQN